MFKWPPANSTFRADYEKAVGINNKEKRKAVVAKMQKEEFEKGGYIIPFFNNFADAFSTKLKGVDTGPSQLNMGYFGHGFKGWNLA